MIIIGVKDVRSSLLMAMTNLMLKFICWMKGSTEFNKNINMLQKNPLFDPMESG